MALVELDRSVATALICGPEVDIRETQFETLNRRTDENP